MNIDEVEKQIASMVEDASIQEAVERYAREPVLADALATERLIVEAAVQLYLGALQAKRPITTFKAAHDAKDMLLEARFFRVRNGL